MMTMRLVLVSTIAAAFAAAPGRAQQVPSDDPGVVERLGLKVATDVSLKDEDGRDVTIGQLLGKPTILTLNYYRCAGICTPLLNNLLRALNEVDAAPEKDFQVLTVSFDPRDTPDVASRKRVNYLTQMKRPFPPAAWRFLTGEATATRRLADSVGFGFRAQGDDFIHPGVIVFLSPDGVITRYMYGTRFLAADITMAIGEAAKGEARPTISKFLAFCYSYDPDGRRYAFRMTRVIGAILLVMVIGYVAYLGLKGRAKKEAKPRL
jgi:protein SCO1